MREKVLTFLTHKSKPGVLQTMLVLVKVLSGQYHSYPLTQLDFTGKSLCKYYISMMFMLFCFLFRTPFALHLECEWECEMQKVECELM